MTTYMKNTQYILTQKEGADLVTLDQQKLDGMDAFVVVALAAAEANRKTTNLVKINTSNKGSRDDSVT